MPDCPLCSAADAAALAEVHARRYFECGTCHLVFMAPEQRLDAAGERKRYDAHENDPADERYRAFLNQLAAPLCEVLQPGARGLDFGSGPGPTLSLMLAERGFPTAIYDPLYAPDPSVLAETYDFITCTEAVEHFHSPATELALFDRMLRPAGWLGLLTALRNPERPFATWPYVRDPTHVCFYDRRTMAWIAARHGWSVKQLGTNVTLFQKPRRQSGN